MTATLRTRRNIVKVGGPGTRAPTIRCAFCRGEGKDPFGVPSELSDCQVCLGRGEVTVREPALTCVFCDGSGVQPYTSSRLTCSVCGGKGVVPVKEPFELCADCEGSGAVPEEGVPCKRCRGTGILSHLEPAEHIAGKEREIARRQAEMKTLREKRAAVAEARRRRIEEAIEVKEAGMQTLGGQIKEEKALLRKVQAARKRRPARRQSPDQGAAQGKKEVG